jgi:hypothetical protein
MPQIGVGVGPLAWSSPGDGARWVALALSALAAVLLWREMNDRVARWVVRLAPAAAAAISVAYVAHYLRGGPRIIDATSYYLQASALARGMFALPVDEPEHALLGRFLLRTEWHGPAASVIFPPGWPAALAIGFWLGVPMAVGPLLAAGLCGATSWLARTVARHHQAESADRAAAAAAIFSVVCSALRYHTADTMSHGWAALCLTMATGATWSALESRRPAMGALAGLAASWLFATRPTTALGWGGAMLLSAAWGWLPAPSGRTRSWWPPLLGAAIAAAAPLALWFAHQRIATGSFFATAQHHYYALSDGPPGCFRYGFGSGIGCRGEHADFVAANLQAGYGAIAALKTTGRRLLLHARDVLNFAPLCVLPLVAMRAPWPMARSLGVMVACQIAAYAPFYFDGNYPGGGGRMFAEALPIEHVLAAIGLAWLASTRRDLATRFARGLAITSGLALFGFAIGAGASHASLRERDGGRVMFEPTQLPGSGVDPKADLIFVDTDHGFNLAWASRARVARHHGDALDRLAWERHGRPRAFLYRHRARDEGPPFTTAMEFSPEPLPSVPLWIDAESLWPPASQTAGWAWPSWWAPKCASGRRALRIEAAGGAIEASITVRLPREVAGRTLTPILGEAAKPYEIILVVDDARAHGWPASDAVIGEDCVRLRSAAVPADARRVELVLRGADWSLDALDFSEKR